MIDLEAARSAVRDEIGSRLCHLTPHGTRICTRQVSSTCLCEETARAALCSQAPTPRCEVRSEELWAAIRQRDDNINAAFAGLNAIEEQLHEMRSLKGWRLNLIRENLEKTRAALRTPTLAQEVKDSADAARYRHLKEHCSYYFSEGHNPPCPREFGIEWHWQDGTPERADIDTLIDREIEEKRVLWALDVDEAMAVPSASCATPDHEPRCNCGHLFEICPQADCTEIRPLELTSTDGKSP